MCQMESKLTNGLVFIFLSFSVLPDDTHDEKLLLKVDATKTEPYLAMCHKQRLLAMVIALPNRDESNRLVQKSLPALFS